jgi:hypothetical protein
VVAASDGRAVINNGKQFIAALKEVISDLIMLFYSAMAVMWDRCGEIHLG